jgi:hypothetical protein
MEYASNQLPRKSGHPSFCTSKPLKVPGGEFLTRIGGNPVVTQGKTLRGMVMQEGKNLYLIDFTIFYGNGRTGIGVGWGAVTGEKVAETSGIT